VYKSITIKTEYYKFWNNRIMQTRLKIHRVHFTFLGVYASTAGRDELNETQMKILDKVNKNDYLTF